MHGLIFETSIWLLAGSTRFLRSSLLCIHTKDWKLHTNWKFSMWLRHAIKHERTEFYFHHTFQAFTTTIHDNTNRKPKLPDQAPNGFPLNATGCETRNSSKVRIQILKHVATPKSCRLEKLHLPTRTCWFTREATPMLNWKTFSMRRLIHPNSTTFVAQFFCRFTKHPGDHLS